MRWSVPRHPDFPLLSDANSVKTSESTPRYNCIAWAAGDDTKKWWPHRFGYWPAGAPVAETIAAFFTAFALLGYSPCGNGDLEVGWQKLALYADADGIPTHMARQLPDGTWTSKLGDYLDIMHTTIDVLHGALYGTCAGFLRRPTT